MIHGSGTATTREKDCAYAKDGNDGDTKGEDVLKVVPQPVAGLEESPTAPADDILYEAQAAECCNRRRNWLFHGTPSIPNTGGTYTSLCIDSPAPSAGTKLFKG